MIFVCKFCMDHMHHTFNPEIKKYRPKERRLGFYALGFLATKQRQIPEVALAEWYIMQVKFGIQTRTCMELRRTSIDFYSHLVTRETSTYYISCVEMKGFVGACLWIVFLKVLCSQIKVGIKMQFLWSEGEARYTYSKNVQENRKFIICFICNSQ